MTVSIAALIPTRNRAELAIAAVRSLLDQDCPIEIFLSDNSSSPEALRDFCMGEMGVHYLRPSRELSMPEHWDWALREVMQRSQATHITLHYDRKISKAREWGSVLDAARRRPDQLLSFPCDFVAIDPPPRRLWQPAWTGKLYSVTTARMAALIAAARILETGQALPILSNCLVPRTTLTRIAQRFGDICNSNSGDAPFICRFLALDDQFLFYDRPIGVGYAPDRSAGMGYLRGHGGDFDDYLKTWGDRKWLERAPVPGVNLGHNMLFHEYEIVREQTGDRLPPIDIEAYLRALGDALQFKTDDAEREHLKRILESHGWTGNAEPAAPRTMRNMLGQFTRSVLPRFRAAPKQMTGFSFRDDAEALRFALEHPLPPSIQRGHLDAIDAEEVAA
jgi:hypothetical protein